MRSIIVMILMTVIVDYASGTPPIAGAFLTGSDSTRYIIWFHPELHLCEQGRDGYNEELNLTAGEEPGWYTVVQKAEFPFISFITDFRVKINQADIYPDLPGDQFSRFEYSVYRNGDDSLPLQPAVCRGENSLCGGIPCDERWVVNNTGWLNIEGRDMWFGFDWADSTPAAPQIKCLFLPPDDAHDYLGIMTSEYYSWQEIAYSPVFRYRFMTPFACDTIIASGWRRRLDYDTRPDSFLIRGYDMAGDSLIMQCRVGSDTLMTCIANDLVDSVEIISCYGICPDDSHLTLVYDRQRSGPIQAAVDFEKVPASGYFDLIVRNTGSSILNLVFSHGSVLEGLPDEITLDGNQTAVIPVSANLSESDSLDLMIIIRDKQQQFYPILVKAAYPPQDPTETDDENVPVLPDRAGIELYPNPFHDIMKIRAKKHIRADRIEIFNLIGQKVFEKRMHPGIEIIWDGCDSSGRRLPAGVYFARIRCSGGSDAVKKIILLHK